MNSKPNRVVGRTISCLGLLMLIVVQTGCGDSNPPLVEPASPIVTVSQVVQREVTDYDDYEGRIAAVRTVEVRARVRGQLVKVLFRDGQLVKAGEPLFEIDMRPYKSVLDSAKALKASAEAGIDLAKSEVARINRLLSNRGAATREELEQWMAKEASSKADRDKAEAEIVRAKLDLEFCQINAPIAGRVSRPLVTEGNLVNSGGGDTLLTTIVGTGSMYVYFNVDERALLDYRREYAKGKELKGEENIKEENIPVFVAIEGDEKHTLKGTIDFVENRVSRSTGTIEVRGILDNAGNLLSEGMRARVRIQVGKPHQALLITDRAIGTDQGIKYVYVVNDQNEVVRKEVKPGRTYDRLIAINSGLKAKEWVIVNGIQRVREGMKVDPHRAPMPGDTAPAGEDKASK
jgi:RND family efflux transporter MFP subunit